MNRYEILLGKKQKITNRMLRLKEDEQKSRRVKRVSRVTTANSRVGAVKNNALSVIGNLDWVAEQLEDSGHAELAQRIDQINDQLEILDRQKRQEQQKRFEVRNGLRDMTHRPRGG